MSSARGMRAKINVPRSATIRPHIGLVVPGHHVRTGASDAYWSNRCRPLYCFPAANTSANRKSASVTLYIDYRLCHGIDTGPFVNMVPFLAIVPMLSPFTPACKIQQRTRDEGPRSDQPSRNRLRGLPSNGSLLRIPDSSSILFIYAYMSQSVRQQCSII